MDAKTFFLLDFIVVAILIWRVMAARKPQQPTPMDLGPNNNVPSAGPTGDFDENTAKGFENPSRFEAEERSLNCWFQFNGETWDAFEVLGLPAGSTKEACFKALSQMKKRQSRPADFLDLAWVALEQYFSKHQ